MQEKGKEELYDAVKDMLSREDFEEKLKKEIERYGGLIDEDAAAMIVVDKLRRDFFNTAKISELEEPQEVTLYGRVEHAGKVKKFDGGQVANVVISDETGMCMLVLWDNHAGLVEDGKISEGITVKVINGYVKEGYYGIEVNVGRWGLVKIDAGKVKGYERDTNLMDVKSGIVNIKAEIKRIHPTKVFFTEKGERFAAYILAKDESGERIIVLWDEMAKAIQQFREGDTVRIKRAYAKKGEIHAGEISSIEKA
ncbi:MAG: hypothetical protein DRN33_00220 [Thermoplasmata archaeon]|jgi:ssDNA-binding replication factor A large subunit|nr:MAG: hypothetical protein FE043_00635 [Thermoplasmata archaeon]RLF65124.1 MAG: hypothetical protein DRN33_00220 [Thermoplasmata archaeon]